jgi:hypothetical protein
VFVAEETLRALVEFLFLESGFSRLLGKVVLLHTDWVFGVWLHGAHGSGWGMRYIKRVG